MRIPTFVDVLNEAQAWRATNASDALQKARAVLEAGMQKYDDALPLGDELVLVLKRQGALDEAVVLLRQLERRFKQIGEETLCRWGAVHKSRAKQSLAQGALGAAELDCRESERYYARAFEEHHTFYPRINELTTRFVRAGLAKQAGRESESAALLHDVEAKAQALLDDPVIWAQRKPDDAIWAAASRGEARVLLRQWPAAVSDYTSALREAAGRQFYYNSMRDQVRDMLLPACARLALAVEGPLADPETFFALPVAAAPLTS